MIRIRLSTLLGEKRWSQTDLSRKTGIRLATIHELFHEMAARVSFEHLDLICQALDCDISDLIVYIPGEEPIVTRVSQKRAGKVKKKR